MGKHFCVVVAGKKWGRCEPQNHIHLFCLTRASIVMSNELLVCVYVRTFVYMYKINRSDDKEMDIGKNIDEKTTTCPNECITNQSPTEYVVILRWENRFFRAFQRVLLQSIDAETRLKIISLVQCDQIIIESHSNFHRKSFHFDIFGNKKLFVHLKLTPICYACGMFTVAVHTTGLK